jgi:hypothetical protein
MEDNFTLFAKWSTAPSENDGSLDTTTTAVVTETGTTTTQLIINQNGVKIDLAKIDTKKSSVVLDIMPNKDGLAYVTVPYHVLTSLSEKNSDFIIEIKSSFASYQLPVNFSDLIPNMKDLLTKNNLKAEDISFKINLTDKSNDKTIQNTLEKSLPKALRFYGVVDFNITIINTKTEAELGTASNFTKQIKRIIPMQKDMKNMPVQWGAFRYNELKKKFDFVAATTLKTDDVINVIISSDTNSLYVVAENKISFLDVNTEFWGASYIEKAAAKGLVEGVGNGLYMPEKETSRAEFVQMIANAINLPTVKIDTKSYTDVKINDWYYDAIVKAKSAGLLDRFKGEGFNPDATITREEMAMISAAVVRAKNILTTENKIDLSTVFDDYQDIDELTLTDIELVYKLKIMQGVGNKKFDPRGITTRAQAATMQINLLKALGMID